MTCSNCGSYVEVNTQFCNHCGSPMQAAPPMQQEHPPQPMHHMQQPYAPYAPPRPRLPGAGILLVAGIGNIIVGAIFIIIGLSGFFGDGMGMLIMWCIFGGIIAGDGVRTILHRNIFEKISELRTAMIVGLVVLGIALVYFLFSGPFPFFFVAIIIPDIVGFIGAQMNHKYAAQNR